MQRAVIKINHSNTFKRISQHDLWCFVAEASFYLFGTGRIILGKKYELFRWAQK